MSVGGEVGILSAMDDWLGEATPALPGDTPAHTVQAIGVVVSTAPGL